MANPPFDYSPTVVPLSVPQGDSFTWSLRFATAYVSTWSNIALDIYPSDQTGQFPTGDAIAHLTVGNGVTIGADVSGKTVVSFVIPPAVNAARGAKHYRLKPAVSGVYSTKLRGPLVSV